MAVLLLATGYWAVASMAVASVAGVQDGALLAVSRSAATVRLDELADRTMHTALIAMPLDQRVANVAAVREAHRHGDARTAVWLDLLGRLGWRNTPAVQNMLYAAARRNDLPKILDLGDALMRRQQLSDQIIPVLLAVEGDPVLRTTVAARLAGRPNWRAVYLTATGQLQTRAQLLARFELLRSLEHRAAALEPGEVAPNIVALDRGGLPQYGFALWQRMRPGTTRPLDDTDFALASRSYVEGGDPVPYQWRMTTGQGFSADVSGDGPHASLAIDWDGRGVPVFAEQRTSAAPGAYTLDVAVAPEDVADLPAVGFRLVCGNQAVAFRPTGPVGHYVTATSVSCAYPVLQLVGEIQPGATAHQLAFERIAMRPLGPAAGR